MHYLHTQCLCVCCQKSLESNHCTNSTQGEVIKLKEPVPLTTPAQFSNPPKVTDAGGVSLKITLLRGRGDL
jgi:hypothetical protein